MHTLFVRKNLPEEAQKNLLQCVLEYTTAVVLHIQHEQVKYQ